MLTLLFSGLLGLFVVTLLKKNPIKDQIKEQTQIVSPTKEAKAYTAKSDEQGEVVVKATPVSLKGGEAVVFDIVLDTHSVNLDYDLVGQSSLTDNKGDIYQALSWIGGRGGHHLSGKLTFPSSAKEVTSVTLTIKNIDNIDRVFTWGV